MSARPLAFVRAVLADAIDAYLRLLKVLVPALIAVRLLDELGATELLAALLSPALELLGLPGWAGVVWAATLLTNIFTGMVLFLGFAAEAPPSVAEATVLGTLMLVGHSLPVEGAVARRAGLPWRVTIALRVGGALVLGALLNATYAATGTLVEPVELLWSPAPTDDSLAGWALAQGRTLALVFVVIVALLVLLAALCRLGVERAMHAALAPLLRAMGIGRTATNVTVIGVVLGLTYGAGLVFRDVDAGAMSRRDSALALAFLGLVHSVIEDTILIAALGAHLSGILWARLAFSIALVALLARWLPERAFVARARS